ECLIQGVTLCENTTNTVTATGQSVFDGTGSGTARDQNSATGMVAQASIACATRVSSPDDQDGNSTDNHVLLPTDGLPHNLSYEITVTAGDASLARVAISDATLTALGCSLPPPFSLLAHASTNFTCTVSINCLQVPAGGLRDTATVNGEVDTSQGVCGHDTHGQPISVHSECTSLVECLAPPCKLTLTATACVATNAPPPTTAGVSCTGGAVALTIQYTGATINAPTVV